MAAGALEKVDVSDPQRGDTIFCQDSTLVNTFERGLHAIPLKCRSWSCPDCAPDRKSQLIAQAFAGKPDTFITLTVNPQWGPTLEARASALARAWRLIVARAKRRYGYDRIAYMCVFEACESGEPHLHIIGRIKWIDQDWLSKQMKGLMEAPVVDIRRVRSKHGLAQYISKYMGKNPHHFGTTKRYWSTRDWQKWRQYYKSEKGPPIGRWRIEPMRLESFIESMETRGYRAWQAEDGWWFIKWDWPWP